MNAVSIAHECPKINKLGTNCLKSGVNCQKLVVKRDEF